MAEQEERSSPTIEDLIVLQSTVESLRQERDQLLRRLQFADSSARERLQLTEARYREALAQVEALKRAAQQIREQLEQEVAEARQQLQLTSEQARQWQLTAEGMRQRASELEALLDGAHSRVADLETENAVLQAEIERLQSLHDSTHAELEQLRASFRDAENARALEASRNETMREAVARLEKQHNDLQEKLKQALELAAHRLQENEALSSALQLAERKIGELEGALASVRSELDLLRAAQERERQSWQAELASKSEEWTQERDTLARALEQEQNRCVALEREAGALRAQLCSLQMRAQNDAEQALRLEEELEAQRTERQREREIFEALGRQREAEWQERFEELRQSFDRYRTESEQRIAALRAELEQAGAAAREAANEIRRLQELLATATASRAALEQQAARDAKELEVLRQASEESQHQRERLEAQAAEAARQISALRAEIADATALAESYRTQLAEAHHRAAEQTASWESERSQLQQKINDLELAQLQADAELEQACWQIRVLDAALQKATVEHHAAALAAAEAHSDAARWQLVGRLQASAYEALEQRYQEHTEAAAQRREVLAALVRTLSLEREELCRRQAQLRATLEAKTLEQQEFEARYQELRHAHMQALDEAARLRQALHELEARAAALTGELAQQQEANARLLVEHQESLSERDRSLAGLAEERQQMLRRIAELESALAEARAQSSRTASTYQEEIAALRAELASWPERAAALAEETQERVRSYEEALRTKDRAYEQLQAEYRSLEDQARSLAVRCEEQAAVHEQALTELEQTRQHLEALQEQTVAVLQSQEVLTQENLTLREELQRLETERQRLSEAQKQLAHEREVAMARWQESETLRQKEQANYLAVRQQLDAEREALREALDAARAQQAQLQAQIALLQREKAARTSLAAGDLVEFERERAELKAQVEKLSAVIRQLGQEREEQRVAALQTQSALTARIDELAAERGALTLRVAELETLVSQLDRECERLRKERLSPEELRRYKAEVSRLEARVEELERLRAEAAQNHSAVVAGYLLELNQRTDALQAKEAEIQKLQRELQQLRATLEELQGRLHVEQEERAQLEAALDELRRAAAGGSQRATFKTPPAPPVTSPQLRLAEPAAVSPGAPTGSGLSRTQPIPGTQPSLAELAANPGLSVVHLEEAKECREGVQRLLKQLPGVRYLNTLDLAEPLKERALLFVVNLLNRAHDPIAALARVVRHTGDYGIFAYCADGKFGFLFGEATFFPSPFDVDACTTWLMSTYGTIQRLLVASNNIEMTSELRTALAKIRCSASVALDYRQVVELVPLIQPEVVLVDLSLPRADGLRLISRLRNDEKTAALPLGIILPDHHRVAEFRQNAARAAREGSLSVETLVTALARQLGLAEPRSEKGSGTIAAQST